MKGVSRRKFLTMAGGAAGSLALHSAVRPAVARAHGGCGHNLILVNLVGGCDGLALAPYYEGPVANYINATLRPTLGIDPASVLTPWAQNGIANKVGLHSAFQSLMNVSNVNLCLAQGVGILNYNDRSHNSAQSTISLGSTGGGISETRGFLPRLMDLLNMEMLQFWALSPQNSTDTNAAKVQPVVVYGLDSLGFSTVGWESNDNRDLAVNLERQLLGLQSGSGGIGQNYASGMLNMHDVVSTVQNDVANQIVGGNSAGDYGETWFGSSIRDMARVLKAKSSSVNFGQSGADSIFMTTQHGYDTHNDQANPGQTDRGIAALFEELSVNLSVLATDLQSWGMWDCTTIVIYSEFGRTLAENSNQSTAGTDHGNGGQWLILGGQVSPGVVGVPCTLSEVQDEWYNAQISRIDYRDVFSEVIQSCFGVSGSAIFSGHSPQALGIMQA